MTSKTRRENEIEKLSLLKEQDLRQLGAGFDGDHLDGVIKILKDPDETAETRREFLEESPELLETTRRLSRRQRVATGARELAKLPDKDLRDLGAHLSPDALEKTLGVLKGSESPFGERVQKLQHNRTMSEVVGQLDRRRRMARYVAHLEHSGEGLPLDEVEGELPEQSQQLLESSEQSSQSKAGEIMKYPALRVAVRGAVHRHQIRNNLGSAALIPEQLMQTMDTTVHPDAHNDAVRIIKNREMDAEEKISEFQKDHEMRIALMQIAAHEELFDFVVRLALLPPDRLRELSEEIASDRQADLLQVLSDTSHSEEETTSILVGNPDLASAVREMVRAAGNQDEEEDDDHDFDQF